MKLSVVIITFNEEQNIGRCIDSVKNIADEIIVLDSLSTDKTVEIAESKGARVIPQPFLGYIQQKNKALSYATGDYVLCLDADEAVNSVLETSIKNVKALPNPGPAYNMNRSTHYCGKFIKHGTWYPDRKLRLFQRPLGYWGGTNPHDKILLKSEHPIKRLKGDLLHYSYDTIEEHAQQNNRFSSISAESLFQEGKRTNIFKIVIHPFWAFILAYIIRVGFLDGFYGFVVAVHVAQLSFLKHVKLYQIQNGAQ